MMYTIKCLTDNEFEFTLGEVDIPKSEIKNVKESIEGFILTYGGWEFLCEVL